MLPPSCLSALRSRPHERQVDPEMRGDANNTIEAAGRGWMPKKQNLPVKGKVFLLDIPFYRTRQNLKLGSPRANADRHFLALPIL
jgi:hypothetical protein